MNKSPQTVSENPEPDEVKAPSGPPSEEVLTYLQTILSSDVFSGAARQQRLLRHLVQRRLEGKSNELKEYTLGVEVFDRGEDFDPRLDPIVRVEASRLRSRLQKYYDAPGAGDRVRISLPRGAYVPSFDDVVMQAAAAPAPAAQGAATTAQTLTGQQGAVFNGTNPAESRTEASASDSGVGRRQRLFVPALVTIGFLLAVIGGLVFWRVSNIAANAPPPDFVNFRRITSDQEPCTNPSFSPDGKFLVYARREAGRWSLFERDLNSLGVTELTPDMLADSIQPAWSPDGRSIAFHSEQDGGGIYLLDVKTRKTSRLTDGGYHPAWSPDSKKLVYSTGSFSDPAESSTFQSSALRVISLKTKQTQQLGPTGSAYDALQPAWSPDGRRIAFWGTNRKGSRDIWTMPADGTGQPEPVTRDTWTDWSATWSPDGRYLYFSSDRGGAMNLWRVRINQRSGEVLGKPEAVTTPSPYSGWTSFAADGKEFAYVHRLASSQLYRAPFDIEKGLQLDQRVELTGGERSVREPEMSPDGKWIVLRVQDPQEDLALIRPDGTNLHRITNDRFNDRSPHWSPDGTEIVFLSNRSGQSELWAIRPDGSQPRQLTHGGALPYVWSPNGNLLEYPAEGPPSVVQSFGKPDESEYQLPPAFRPIAWSPTKGSVVGRMRSTAFSRGSLFIFSPASADYWEIAPTALYPAAVWLNDGFRLLFSREEGIYLADLHTHGVKQIAPSSRGEMHSRFTLSRDNRSFFFVWSDDQEDIWVGSQ